MVGTSANNKPSVARPSACSCVNVRRASRAITKLYDSVLAPSALKITQYSALANIMQHGPISISKLAGILTLDRTTLVRNLKSLESSGLIENGTTADTRERAVSITEAGRLAVTAAKPYWQTAQNLVAAQLGQENLKQLGVLVMALENISLTTPEDDAEDGS